MNDPRLTSELLDRLRDPIYNGLTLDGCSYKVNKVRETLEKDFQEAMKEKKYAKAEGHIAQTRQKLSAIKKNAETLIEFENIREDMKIRENKKIDPTWGRNYSSAVVKAYITIAKYQNLVDDAKEKQLAAERVDLMETKTDLPAIADDLAVAIEEKGNAAGD